MIMHSKISYIMFSHHYLLACEISTVRTLDLREKIFKIVHSSIRISSIFYCNHCNTMRYLLIYLIVYENVSFVLFKLVYYGDVEILEI